MQFQRTKIYRYFRLLTHKGIKWLSARISQRNYQILVAIAIGIVAGLAAVVLKFSVATVREWMKGNDPTHGKIGFVFFPIIGILLTRLYFRYGLRRKLEIGSAGLIFAISRKKVNLPSFETFAHLISSSLTVGFGGSVGLEAPIVRTGSAIGSNLARLLRVGRKRQTLFLACGAAAGLAAIFNSPVAGVIFAFEVLITDIGLPAFIPLLISAATGAVVARFFYYEQLFYLPTHGWTAETIPFFVLTGIACGFYSTYLIRSIPVFEGLITKIQRPLVRLILGGLALGLLIFLMPPLFGEGYETINQLFQGSYSKIMENSLFYRFAGNSVWVIIGFAVAILMAKTAATSFTIALGGNGGIFAPSMFAGGTLGFILAATFNQLGFLQLPVADFVAVGMAGIMSGVIKSPLTGIFLIAEITGGYSLFIPLMIVSAISYFVTFYFEPHSIFTRTLYEKGIWAPSHEKDKIILQNMDLLQLVESNFSVLRPQQTLGEFVKIIAQSKRNLFPVVDEEEQFLGIILLDDVREVMFQPQQYKELLVADLFHQPPAILQYDDSMDKVMNIFEEHQAWNLPVVKEGKYMGFVSKSTILGHYRELLQDRSVSM
ncbi:MAG: chloride channel protein [Saprospirales bacterium]|nr:chloride channel protein [Saprospirales bacterium]MBK8491365.1 chloride channel protein [Saprospirales bacterium]